MKEDEFQELIKNCKDKNIRIAKLALIDLHALACGEPRTGFQERAKLALNALYGERLELLNSDEPWIYRLHRTSSTPWAQYLLGRLHHRGGLEENPSLASIYYFTAAENKETEMEAVEGLKELVAQHPDDPVVLRYLGKCYLKGYGAVGGNSESSRLEGIKLISQAATIYLQNAKGHMVGAVAGLERLLNDNPDDPVILRNLGICYLYGYSVPQNIVLAMSLLNMAAHKQDSIAMFHLGHAYEQKNISQ